MTMHHRPREHRPALRLSRIIFLFSAFSAVNSFAAERPADLIVHHAKVVTVDEKVHLAEAVAVRAGRIIAVGDNETVLQHQGPNTRLLDVKGRTVLPGLYDSHAPPAHAAVSEFSGPLPALKSLKDVFAYIQNKTAET